MTLAAGLALLVTATLAAQGAGGSFGPKPIYLRGSALAWQLRIERDAAEVFEAAKKAGKKQRLAIVERRDADGVLRLSRANQKGATLDKHCAYPIVNYYSWRPLENYATAQSNALSRRRPGESLGRAGRLNGTVHVSIRAKGGGLYEVQSICSAFLHEWGLVEATSLGILEIAFLEAFLAELGMPMEIELPQPRALEPSRANPTRDLHVAQLCQEKCTPFYRCSGMYVDPETLELRCVEEASGAPTQSERAE
jgi:hypothetical protein